jgi:hypothetical protein
LAEPEKRRHHGGDRAARQSAPDRQARLHREGHRHGEREQGDAQSREHVGPEGGAVAARDDAPDRHGGRPGHARRPPQQLQEVGGDANQALEHGLLLFARRASFNRFLVSRGFRG